MDSAEILYFQDFVGMDVNPQVEDGRTSFANDLMDAILLFPFKQRQLKVVLAVARQTYGWKRKTHHLTTTFIAGATGLDRSNVSKAIQELKDMHVLHVTQEPGKRKEGMRIGINKHFNQWSLPESSAVKTTAKEDLRSKQPDICGQNDTQRNKVNKGSTKRGTSARKKSAHEEAFDRFYAAYPRKKQPADARKAWKKVPQDPVLYQRILDALEAHKKTPDWLKDGGQFIPYPASWLNAESWNDALEVELEEVFTPEQQAVVDVYNQVCGSIYGYLNVWTATRASRINTMLKHHPAEKWEKYFKFVRDENDFSNLTCPINFDFLTKPENFSNILAGDYRTKGGDYAR